MKTKALLILCILVFSGCVSRNPAPVVYHGASDGITKEIVRILKENPKIIPKSIEPVFSQVIDRYQWNAPQGEKKPPAQKHVQKTVQKSTQKPQSQTTKFAIPVAGKIISSFGAKSDGQHNDGINIKAPRSERVSASEAGEIVFADDNLKAYGNLVLIRHKDDYMTAYAHLDSLTVKKGDPVQRGAMIGTVGSTGNVVTPQLHFEIRKGSKPLNPQLFF